MAQPLMPHATASWLVENSSLTFEQIAEFCGLHVLEVKGIADGSRLIPTDRFDDADMLRWMFWEQYNHEPNIATLRFWTGWVGLDNITEVQRLQVPGKREAGNAALKLMDDHLARREWFVGEDISLADICLFAYTHVAGDADFRLNAYPHLSSWIERVQKQPNFLPMDG